MQTKGPCSGQHTGTHMHTPTCTHTPVDSGTHPSTGSHTGSHARAMYTHTDVLVSRYTHALTHLVHTHCPPCTHMQGHVPAPTVTHAYGIRLHTHLQLHTCTHTHTQTCTHSRSFPQVGCKTCASLPSTPPSAKAALSSVNVTALQPRPGGRGGEGEAPPACPQARGETPQLVPAWLGPDGGSGGA